ncbi:MAG: TetR/AcrR family transcriptional regulator [Crocinitomicaceae bacterium]
MEEMNTKEIINAYTEFVLDKGEKPKSIYKFCKSIGCTEKEFYNHFNSFETLEESIFGLMFEETIKLLNNDDAYQNYDNQTKLLSFYYTYFELLTENRSFVVFLLKPESKVKKEMYKLKELRKLFKGYIQSLNLKIVDIPKEEFQKIQNRSIEEIAWVQFLATLKFWFEDTSKGFEKTDLFIEKSLKASFDLIELTPVKNIIDFGKFLWKEKMKH